MIKAVIFDLSDVCFNAEEPPFIKAFAAKHGLDFPEFETRYNNFLHKAENHEIAGRDIWKEILTHYGIRENIDGLIRNMIAGKKPYKKTFELIAKLRRICKTAFFTNYNEDYWKLIKRGFDFSNYFDVGLVSYQIGARKPAVKGFKHLLKKLAVKPAEVVFTDDSAKNLENARKLGIRTIQFQNVEQLARDLREKGVSVE